MAASAGDNRVGEGHEPGGALQEVLLYDWHRPVLEVLAGGAKRYSAIKAELFTAHDPAPGEGQVSSTLRELQQLGLVHKGIQKQDPWTLTDHGAEVLKDLAQLNHLMTRDPDRAVVQRGPDTVQNREEYMARIAALSTDVAHPARRYNYWLGGKDNFEADRKSGDELELLYPGMRDGVRANRAVLGRIVHQLTTAGIRQFLDIGTGLPTADNTHQVAQAIAPESRIVYVDNDRMVLSHARALLTSAPEGETAYIEADLRNPDTIITSPVVRDTIDLTRPVGLLLIGVLHFIPDADEVKSIVAQLRQQLAPGSYLAVTHVTDDFTEPEVRAAHEDKRRAGRSDFVMRTEAEFTDLFEGFELQAPGVVPTSRWRRKPDDPDPALNRINAWAGVGRKPPTANR